MKHASVLAATILVFLCQVSHGQEERMLKVPSVSVVGTGEVKAKPDLAQISAGVVIQDESAAEAMQKNSERMSQLLTALREAGVAEKDIQTSQINVSPVYNYDQPGERSQRVVGYQVTNMVQVRVRKLESLGRLLDQVLKAGANQIHGISFSLAEPEQVLDEARRKAINDARRKAELYASAAGAKVGEVLLIEEQSVGGPQPVIMEARVAMAAPSGVPVSPGEQSHVVNANVTYRLLHDGGEKAKDGH